MNKFNSTEYWENRYKQHKTSGYGSYNNLAIFKANIINSFIEKHTNEITTIIDHGVGDGNQLKLLNINPCDKNYIGIDVSPTIINKCRLMFADEPSKLFMLADDIVYDASIQRYNITADLVISCDVLYHLIEDHIYEQYISQLFNMSTKYVIIYAKNANVNHTQHVKFRKFTQYISTNMLLWKLIEHIPNKYPQHVLGKNNSKTSPSDFYIYKYTS